MTPSSADPGSPAALLGPSQVRALAERLGIRPTKSWGQNFVVDAGTVRRIVRLAGVAPGEHVLEVGPGLGSLTLGLLDAGARVTAVEIDPVLARALPGTVAQRAPALAANLRVLTADALDLAPELLRAAGGSGGAGTQAPGIDDMPTALVANLPYNVAVPVLLTALERLPALDRALVMVQAEVADRLAAPPGSRTYGIPSAKAAWYAHTRRAGTIGRSVFWPVPRVDSALVECVRRPPPGTTATREAVFAVIDAAFAQRRKTMRAALTPLAGTAILAEEVLRDAGVDPTKRGERLAVADFAQVAAAFIRVGIDPVASASRP